MTAVLIRRLGHPDLLPVQELIVAHAHFEGVELEPEDRSIELAAAFIGPQAFGSCLVAVVDGAVASYATTFEEFSTWSAARYFHMDTLFVLAQWRDRGLGRQLFEAVLADVSARGIGELQWQTPSWNEDAARFYRRFDVVEAPKIRFTISLP